MRTLTLAAGLEPERLARALNAVHPRAVVLSGGGASLDVLARLVFAARRVAGDRVVVLDFRGALPDTGSSTVERLGDRPIEACERLLALLDGSSRGTVERSSQTLRAVGSR